MVEAIRARVRAQEILSLVVEFLGHVRALLVGEDTPETHSRGREVPEALRGERELVEAMRRHLHRFSDGLHPLAFEIAAQNVSDPPTAGEVLSTAEEWARFRRRCGGAG